MRGLRRVNLQRPADELDLAAVADELAARLGRPVSLLMERDDDGSAIISAPGAPELGEAEILDAAANYTPREPEPDPLERLEQALGKATTIAALRSALMQYVTAEKSVRTRIEPADELTQPRVEPAEKATGERPRRADGGADA